MSKITTIFLPAAHKLTITGDASSYGYCHILDGTQSAYQSIAASSTLVLGPFNTGRSYKIVSQSGRLTYGANEHASVIEEWHRGDSGLATFVTDNWPLIQRRALSLQVTAGKEEDNYIVIPYACQFTRFYIVLRRQLQTANELITFSRMDDTTPEMIDGPIGIDTAVAAGQSVTFSVSTNNTFIAGQVLKIETAGNGTLEAAANITLLLELIG